MKRGYIDTIEGQVHYRTEGSGEPLLLLHRSGLSSDEFTEVMPLLSKRYRVFAMDLLGHGSSNMPSRACRIEDYVRNTIHFLDALNIKNTNIVGSITGATVAVEMAIAYPARVNKLVLSDFIYSEPELQRERLALHRSKSMEIKEDGTHLITLWKDRLSMWKERSSLGQISLETVQRDVVDHLRPALGIKAEDGHIAVHTYTIDIGAKLPSIKSPTLLLYGAAASYLRWLEAAKKLIPKCQTKIIECAGLVEAWKKPQEFAHAILEFLETP